ncbi:hypothetical protein FHR24_001595 [Wenyingzhuangia heitensis]|uniref:Outer membrane protein beta-barrel domain-containing protein n=1 Tax=Wenyingzhuangia heitensis TaxID=1487859 RepID=A0ABX0UC79_9FLAO|nr:porin family protein [Wenyingzhuangia heitensis]NIJ45156.1 hypothetical protein [Wenyingzhuangia heitensis]
MKKSILILSLLTSTLMFAQESLYKKSSIGIKGGYNLASAQINGDNNVDQRHGFHIGFYNEIFLQQHFAIQTELLYSQHGYKVNNDSGKFTQKLDYITLPVLFKGYLSDNFYIEAGPQFAVAVNHTEEVDANFDIFDSTTEFSPNDYDFGANIGTGFKTDSGINLGVRYYFGLNKVYDEENQKNRVLQVSLGFDF